MPYRTVTKVGKLCGELWGHSQRHAVRIATSATQKFPDRLPDGRDFLDLFEFQMALGDRLLEIRRELEAFENLHDRLLQTNRDLRDLRKSKASDLRERLMQLKKTLDGYFGLGRSASIFDEAPFVPADPEELRRLSRRIHTNMTDPDFPLPAATQAGVVVNTRVLAAGFMPHLEALEGSLVDLEKSESEVKHTQSLKDQAIEEAETFAIEVGRFDEALYTVAGHKRLAGRLRRSTHRRPDEPGEGSGADGFGELTLADLPETEPFSDQPFPPTTA